MPTPTCAAATSQMRPHGRAETGDTHLQQCRCRRLRRRLCCGSGRGLAGLRCCRCVTLLRREAGGGGDHAAESPPQRLIHLQSITAVYDMITIASQI